jgi:hypothetical protein
MTNGDATRGSGLERLRAYTERRPRTSAAERCELCGEAIDEAHGHLVNVKERTLLCACRPCYLLFAHQAAPAARFLAVPQRYRLARGVEGADAEWHALQLPIGLAFFLRNGLTGRISALYPSPAGATESELPLDAWDVLVGAVPALQTLEPDVEALLVRRQHGRVDALIAPIDACYELVGRLRRSWRGFQGGPEAWDEVDAFFAQALQRARDSGDAA